MAEQKKRAAARTRKKPPVGMLLSGLVFLLIACTAVFILGLSWRAKVGRYMKTERLREALAARFDACRERLNTMERMGRAIDVDPDEMRSMAQFITGGEESHRSIALEVLKDLPKDADIHMLLGRGWEFQYQYDSALAEYTEAIQYREKTSEAYWYRGMLRFRKVMRRSLLQTIDPLDPDVVDTVTDLRKFVSFWPGWERKHLATGINKFLAPQKEDDIANAFGQIKTAMTFDDSLWVGPYARSVILRKLGEDEKAIARVREAIGLFAYAAEPHALLGDLLEQSGSQAAARDAFETAVRFDPWFMEAYVRLAQLLVKDGQYSEAWVRFDQALQLSPDHPAALEGMARSAFEAWRRTGRNDEKLLTRAVNSCNRYLNLELKKNAPVRRIRGQILVYQEKAKEAIPELTAAWQEDQSIDSLLLRAWAYESHFIWYKAAADYTKAMELGGDETRLLRLRARARANGAKMDEALADYDRLIALDPSDLSARHEKAGLLLLGGKPADAMTVIGKALDINPRYSLGIVMRARIHLKNNDPDAADADLKQALDLDPTLAAVHLVQGDVHAHRGNKEAAKRSWQRAVDMRPSFKKDVERRIGKLGDS